MAQTSALRFRSPGYRIAGHVLGNGLNLVNKRRKGFGVVTNLVKVDSDRGDELGAILHTSEGVTTDLHPVF